MGEDLKAGGVFDVDEEGNVKEKSAIPQEPLTEAEKERARKVFPPVDMDKSGTWEEEELVAMYRAGDSRTLFGLMDRSPRNGKVSEKEFLAYLPQIKPHRGSKSLKFTLRHMEKNIKGLSKHVSAAEGAALSLGYYTPKEDDSSSMEEEAHRMARYQILLEKSPPGGADLHYLYVDMELPEGAKVSQAHFYREGNVPYGEAPTRDCAVRAAKGSPVRVRCKMDKLEVRVTIYIHAYYPEDRFDTEELDQMKRRDTKATAALMITGKVIHTATAPFLQQKQEQDEL